MDAFRKTFGMAGVAAAAVAVPLTLAAPTAALAHEPDVEIVSPTAAQTVFVPQFPAVVPISFTVSHTDLKNLNVLNVKVDDVSIFTNEQPIGNPFDNSNQCSSSMVLPSISGCLAANPNAQIQAPWTVQVPGQNYVITVSVKHQGISGEDEEEYVSVQLLNVEYPAPPAVANAYINANYKRTITPSCRGRIISEVALEHASEGFGLKGGPYTGVESFVYNLIANGVCNS